MFCSKCGAQLSDGARFCPKCGASIAAAETPAEAPVEAPAEHVDHIEQFSEPAYVPTEGYIPPELGYEPAASTSPEIPEKKANKGLIAGIVAAVAVVLCAILFFAWIRPTYLSDAAKYDRAINQATTAMSDEDYDAAIEAYTTALSRASTDDESFAAYVGLGDAYMGAEKFEKAIDAYEAALDIDDKQKKVWGKLADAYLADDDTDGAIEALEKGIDKTGASSLQAKLDELTGTSSATTDSTASSDDTTVSDDSATSDGEIVIGGLTFSVDDVYINLESATEPIDLSPLAACTSLRGLYLSHTDVTDLSPIAGLTTLDTIYLDHTNITDLSPLANLTNLTVLSLYDTPVSDITPLRNLTRLEQLTLWDTNVSDLSPLSGLTSLTYLDLDGIPATDITPILGLTNLTTLYIEEDNFGGEEIWNTIGAAIPYFEYRMTDTTTTTVEDDGTYITFAFVVGDGFTDINTYGDPYGFAYDIMTELANVGEFVPFYLIYETLDEAMAAMADGQVDALIVGLPNDQIDDLYGDISYGILMPSSPYHADGTDEYSVLCTTMQVQSFVEYAMEQLLDNGTIDALADEWGID